jgi:phosphotriesterase-related protein
VTRTFQAVLGPVGAEAVAFALPHEHTQISLWQVPGRWDYWQLSPDPEVVVPELQRFREAGGTTLADLTLPGVGRDPAWLVRMSQETGLDIVMGCGWYRAPYYPPEALIDRRSVDSLADELVAELEEGVEVPASRAHDGVGRRVRAGIIGEIGTDKPWLAPVEERVFRAAARASKRTGAAISTHAAASAVGLDQLRILEEEGADPGRVVVGHADSYPFLDHYLEIIRRGASIEFDFLGMSFTPQERAGEPRVIALLLELLSRGHVERILLSQDVCHDAQLRHYGGNGYTYLQDTFLPRLRAAGASEEEIDVLTVRNPLRVLAMR